MPAVRLPRMTGWRVLGGFWALVVLAVVAGGTTLQALGPPVTGPSVAIAAPPEPTAPSVTPASAVAPAITPNAIPAPAAPPVAPDPPAAPPAGQIASPDPALLEPSSSSADVQRPRIAADGRTSMTVYSRPVDLADRRPRIAMLVVGFGQSAVDSSVAMASLPGAVTLGFSPYAAHPEALLKEARALGHEYLVTLPMESQGYPLNQSGLHALLTTNSPAANDAQLQWVLSRMQGEVGLTGASDGLRGERFAFAAVPFGVVLNELASRGLLYVDPRAGTPSRGAVVGVTAVVDDPPTRAEIDAKLAALEQQARDTGVAVGLAGPLRPATVERVAIWARGLDSRGILLVPISALVAAKAS